jgi:glycosyltransferase involved in cell wall biosynthesis
VDAIERLLTDKAYYDRFRNAALAAAETQFSWKFEAERMVEYVRDLASKSRAANSDRSSPDGEASRSA